MRRELTKHAEAHDQPAERPYWTPTWFEGLVGILLAAAWFFGVFVAIRHEEVGFFLTVVYLGLALVGAAVTWLLVWPLMRMLLGEK